MLIRGGSIHKRLAVYLLLAGTFFTASVCNSEKSGKKESDTSSVSQKGEKVMQEVAILETKFGKIVIAFKPDVAPKHVESFKKLAKDGFFDGTTFHRVIPGFMIQGGDPLSKDAGNRMMHGTGGPGYHVKAEFSKLSHKRGMVSAARAQDPDSAGSQFFIVVKDSPFLDGQYSIFGEVIEGMDVADQIVNTPRDPRDNPVDRVEMKVTLELREI